MDTAATRPTVFLHIGEPKSGTSYLQSIVWENREEFAARGLLLPGRSHVEHYRAQWDLRESAVDASDPRGSWVGTWDRLAAIARDAPGKALISAEMLCAAGPKQVERAIGSLEPADVHVVLTVREFTTLVPTEWSETVKHRNPMGWEQWVDHVIESRKRTQGRGARFWRAHDTMAILRRWGALLPPGNVHVITAPGPGAPRTELWHRFMSVLGIDPAGFDMTVARPNTALGLPETEFIQRLNAVVPAMPHWFYIGQVRERFAHSVLAARASDRFTLQLSDRHRPWAVAQADSVVAGLTDSEYDIVGDVNDLKPRPPAAQSAEIGSTSADVLLEMALACLAQVVDDELLAMRAAREREQAAREATAARAAEAAARAAQALAEAQAAEAALAALSPWRRAVRTAVARSPLATRAVRRLRGIR